MPPKKHLHHTPGQDGEEWMVGQPWSSTREWRGRELDSRIGGDPRPQERVVSKDSGEDHLHCEDEARLLHLLRIEHTNEFRAGLKSRRPGTGDQRRCAAMAWFTTSPAHFLRATPSRKESRYSLHLRVQTRPRPTRDSRQRGSRPKG
jgi:hypothetical protein